MKCPNCGALLIDYQRGDYLCPNCHAEYTSYDLEKLPQPSEFDYGYGEDI